MQTKVRVFKNAKAVDRVFFEDGRRLEANRPAAKIVRKNGVRYSPAAATR